MYVLIFSTTLVRIFLIVEGTVINTLMKSTLYSWQSLRKYEFCRQIFEKSSNVKFHENPSSGSGQTEGQTDLTKLVDTFHNFSKVPNKMET
jgi:hypothetical protein